MTVSFKIATLDQGPEGSGLRRSGNAFTLVEFLVTFGIIAVLASLVLSSMATGKGAAKRAFCNNNLHQISTAFAMYAADNDRYPGALRIAKGWPSTSVALWNAAILPYVNTNIDVFFCPAFPKLYKWSRNTSGSGFNFPTNIQGNRPFCYAINQLGIATAGSLGLEERPQLGRRPTDVQQPSDMIGFGDDTGLTNKIGGWGTFTFSFQFGAPDPVTPIGRVHSGGGNMAFLDGHIDWGEPGKWLGPHEHAARRWNYDNEPHREFWANSVKP
jgi:prepilin-type processing-associated H-X9-DG protein